MTSEEAETATVEVPLVFRRGDRTLAGALIVPVLMSANDVAIVEGQVEVLKMLVEEAT